MWLVLTNKQVKFVSDLNLWSSVSDLRVYNMGCGTSFVKYVLFFFNLVVAVSWAGVGNRFDFVPVAAAAVASEQ